MWETLFIVQNFKSNWNFSELTEMLIAARWEMHAHEDSFVCAAALLYFQF